MNISKLTPAFAILSILLPASYNAFAVTIYTCEDESGNKTFQDRCPPGTTAVTEKKFSSGSSGKETVSQVNATIYVAPTCDACDVALSFLEKHGVNVTKKDVDNNRELQLELRELTGSVRIPTTVIGDKKIIGFDKLALSNALETAGIQPPGEPVDGEEETETTGEIEDTDTGE